jgi:hypothetical protein
VFWEWGNDRSDNNISYGAEVVPGEDLQIELDRSSDGGYTFQANGAVVIRVSLTWVPEYVSADAETHNPGDYLAGSSGAPETVRGLQVKVQGTWRRFSGDAYSTSSSYRAQAAGENLLIWDNRL